jgi:hypothetical protein
MNDIKKLEALLEKATTRGDLTETDLDAETASLRAGWLSLSELIAAAEPEAILPKYSPLSNIPQPQPTFPKRHHHIATVLVAMASAILVAVTIGVFTRNNDSLIDSTQKVATTANPDKTDVSTTKQLPVSTQPKDTANDTELAWNDTLDQEMESTRLAISQSWNDQLAAASHVDYQIESFRKELEDSSL